MKIFDQEHYHLMAQFEREHSGRFDREDKTLWPKGIVYQDGRVNELFLAYRRGYAFCEADMRSDLQNLEAACDGYRDDARALHAALVRMVSMYESEFDHEDTHQWRPKWLLMALARTNALEGQRDTAQEGSKQ